MTRESRVRTERSGSLATVVLDFPDRLNVLDLEGWETLSGAFDELSTDDSVRCVLVRGTGTRAFSAGSDIGAFPTQRSTPEQVRHYGGIIHRAIESVRGCRHPTLAVIEGLCVGGGLEIAVCCDVRVCGESSRFGAPINRLGLTMAYEELEPIVELLGKGVVLDLLLTGELIDAETALRVGLASRVFPHGTVEEEAMALAKRIAAGAPLVNRWHKQFIRRLSGGAPISDEDRREAYEAFQTADYQEGTRAFLEKRPPRFEGA